MTTQPITSLADFVREVRRETEDGVEIQEASSKVMERVPIEAVTTMLLQEAGRYVSPVTVESYVGLHSRYPSDWETALREMVTHIAAVIIWENLEPKRK